MTALNRQQAYARAIDAGATDAEIDAAAIAQARQRSTVPFNNMILALNFHPWSNTREDWTRLAGAMIARGGARA